MMAIPVLSTNEATTINHAALAERTALPATWEPKPMIA